MFINDLNKDMLNNLNKGRAPNLALFDMMNGSVDLK